jgi:hypothetical protein
VSLAAFGFEIEQRIAEAITYRVLTTAWASGPESITATLTDLSDGGKDVSEDCLKGTATSDGDDVITLPQVLALEENHSYLLDVTFEADGDTFAFYLKIHALK